MHLIGLRRDLREAVFGKHARYGRRLGRTGPRISGTFRSGHKDIAGSVAGTAASLHSADVTCRDRVAATHCGAAARSGCRRPLLALASVAGPSQPMIRSAIWRLFLSIIIMWLLPLMPSPGRYRNLAVPPAALMASTDWLQTLRRSSPLGPLEPSV